MAYGIKITLTHNGTTTSPVELRVPMVSVPVGGSIELVFDDKVARSYESGQIRQAVEDLLITTSFNVGTEFSDEVGGGGNSSILEYVSGTELWNFNPHTNELLDPAGDVNDQGIRIKGKEGVSNGFADIFFDESTSSLKIVTHQPTIRDSGDDADIYVYTSIGYFFDDGENSSFQDGGDIEIYTGKGYDSNEEETQGTEGGDMNINLGDGGAFSGRGGAFILNTGNGGNGDIINGGSSGGDIDFNTGDGGSGLGGSEGGDIDITCGNGGQGLAGGGGTGGDLFLRAGHGGQGLTGGQGGYITLRTGEGGFGNVNQGGESGYITLETLDAGGSTLSGANAGDINLTTGQGNGEGFRGGNVNITLGSANGDASGGNLIINGTTFSNGILVAKNSTISSTNTTGQSTVVIAAGALATTPFSLTIPRVIAIGEIFLFSCFASNGNLAVTSQYFEIDGETGEPIVKGTASNSDGVNPYNLYINWMVVPFFND